MTVITMTCLFVGYLMLGVWHDSVDEIDNRSLVDIIYFWIVSFTTVGFGDIGHSLDFEIEHAYELTVYRLFGLSMVAAIIDSIRAYISLRKEILHNETIEKQRKLFQKINTAMCAMYADDDDKFATANALQKLRSISFESGIHSSTIL